MRLARKAKSEEVSASSFLAIGLIAGVVALGAYNGLRSRY
jgi:hypothetical protein